MLPVPFPEHRADVPYSQLHPSFIRQTLARVRQGLGPMLGTGLSEGSWADTALSPGAPVLVGEMDLEKLGHGFQLGKGPREPTLRGLLSWS